MTTEIKAAADYLTDVHGYITNPYRDPAEMEVETLRGMNKYLSTRCTELKQENDDLRRGNERVRRERDELRLLIIQMRKRIADIMHSSLDTVNKV